MNHKTIVIAVLASLLVLFVGGSIYYDSQQAVKHAQRLAQHKDALAKPHAPHLGNPKAKVTIVEFMDPACETCSQFHPFVKKLLQKHSYKLNLVLRYAPFHEGSENVIQLLEASRKAGKYWDVLDLVYQTQPGWASHHNPQQEKIWEYLEYYKFDVVGLRKAMQTTNVSNMIAIDLADAKLLDVHKTPSFFVNGKPLTNFGFEQLEQLVESEIAAHY